MTIETFTTPEKQKERILEYIEVINDEIVPMCIRIDYGRRIEILLKNYIGNDKEELTERFKYLYSLSRIC